MRLKQGLGILTLLLASTTLLAASASQLVEVGVQPNGKATTVAIRATGAFTHTEYRPADNLLLIDLAGVSASKMENHSRKVNAPGIEGYRVLSYTGANGSEITRVELSLSAKAQVDVQDAKSAVLVKVSEAQPPDAPTAEPANAGAKVSKSAVPVKLTHVGVVQGKDGLNVQITATGPIQPQTFTLKNPDRIVLDVPNAVPAFRQRQISVESANVRSIRVSRYQAHPAVARIVLELKQPQQFELAHKGKDLLVQLHDSLPTVVSTPVPVQAPGKVETAAVQKMDAAPAVVVEPKVTSRPATPAEADEMTSPSGKAADAASHFQDSRSEVPLTNVNATMKPQPALNMAAIQRQAGTALPAQAQFTGCTSGHYTGEPISVNLKDVDVRDFFRLVHEISGLNVVLDPQVRGSLTLVLDDVPWDQALAIVLKNNGLDCQLEGNVLRIATVATIKAEADARRAQLEAQALAVEPMTITRYLSYASAKDVVPTIKQFLSQRGSIISDDRTNALIISDIPSVMPNVDRLIRELDRKTQEVEIEARVVAATRNFARDIGTQLGFAWGNGKTTAVGGGSGINSPIIDNIHTPGFISTGNSIPFFSNLGVAPTSGIEMITATNNYRLDFILTMAESRGLLKILSRPRVVTQNNIQAQIRQGTRIPVVTAAQLGGPPSVQYVDAFLRLTVKPQITAEGTIFLNVDVENTVPDRSFSVGGNPSLLTQQATTQVLVTDGGTVVIGGVIQTQNNVSIAQVPLLGNIPVFGNLFKRRQVSTTTQELIFFITPRIIQT